MIFRVENDKVVRFVHAKSASALIALLRGSGVRGFLLVRKAAEGEF